MQDQSDVTWSRGGEASLMAAARHPEWVRALILIDPTILPFSWMWWWYLARKMGLSKRVPIAARAAKRRRVWPDPGTVHRAYQDKEPFRRWQPGFLEGYLADGIRQNANGRAELACDPAWESRCFAVCPHDVWRYVPQLRVPTLVLYGTESDTFLGPAVRRFQRKFPDAVVHGFQETSHFVPMERPRECTEAVIAFLKDHRIL
jgi:pimeloyl-ACP methyl ester carboxylesterase